MIRDLGTIKPGTTLVIPFHTFDSNDPSASVTISGLATSDVEVYKGTSMTQRGSDSGYALLDTDGIDIDGTTGIHGISIDLADNTTAGFWVVGEQYTVVVASVTIDGATINFIPCTFRIGYVGAILETTITVTNQTTLALAVGPAEEHALKGCYAIIHDAASAVQISRVLISAYGTSLAVTLAAAPTFTIATGDNISIFAPPPQVSDALDTAVGGVRDVHRINGVLTSSVTTISSHLGTTGASTAQTGDSYAIVNSGTHGNAALKTLIDTLDDILDTEFPALTTEVGKIPKSDGTSSWNATALAAIQSEANDALVANNLDHLMAVAAVAGDVVNSSIIARLTSKSATPAFTDFVNTTDSLQAIRDNHPSNFNGLSISGGGVVQADLAAILGTECSEVGTLSHVGNNFFKFFFNNEAVTNVQIDEIGEIWSDTNDLQTRVPAALTSDGLMKSDTLRVGGTLQTAGNLASLINTIDDILDTEFPALTTTVGALFTTALTESYRSAGAAPTMAQFAFETLAHLGDCSISSTTKTLNNLAGTAAKTFTLNSATTPTSITEAT